MAPRNRTRAYRRESKRTSGRSALLDTVRTTIRQLTDRDSSGRRRSGRFGR